MLSKRKGICKMRLEQTNRRNLRSNRLSSYFNYTPFRTLFKALFTVGLMGLMAYADTQTPRLGLTLPALDPNDVWGGKLNNNFSKIDSSMCILGGTNSGNLAISGSLSATSLSLAGTYPLICTTTL